MRKEGEHYYYELQVEHHSAICLGIGEGALWAAINMGARE